MKGLRWHFAIRMNPNLLMLKSTSSSQIRIFQSTMTPCLQPVHRVCFTLKSVRAGVPFMTTWGLLTWLKNSVCWILPQCFLTVAVLGGFISKLVISLLQVRWPACNSSVEREDRYVTLRIRPAQTSFLWLDLQLFEVRLRNEDGSDLDL